jgi:hypothetical protein
MDFVVTTSLSPTRQMRSLARELASRLGLPLVRRRNRGLHDTISPRTAAIVVEVDGPAVRVGGAALKFHPNVAKLRVMQLIRGNRDRMVSVMGLRPGDRVLDCTCGLAADATVASYAVGSYGAVHALEASAILAEIVSIGMRTYEDPFDELVQAMRRVKVTNTRYQDFLRSSGDGEYDVVYFDPMFDATCADSTGLDLVRIIGVKGSPSTADIEEAVRVARRCVVMKDRAPGDRLRSLGFTLESPGKKVCYGTIKL